MTPSGRMAVQYNARNHEGIAHDSHGKVEVSCGRSAVGGVSVIEVADRCDVAIQ